MLWHAKVTKTIITCHDKLQARLRDQRANHRRLHLKSIQQSKVWQAICRQCRCSILSNKDRYSNGCMPELTDPQFDACHRWVRLTSSMTKTKKKCNRNLTFTELVKPHGSEIMIHWNLIFRLHRTKAACPHKQHVLVVHSCFHENQL